MANKPFDREVWNIRERPLSTDLNKGQSYASADLLEFLSRMYAVRARDTGNSLATGDYFALQKTGFVGDGIQPRAASPAAMQVRLAAGIGFIFDPTVQGGIGGVSGVDDLAFYKVLSLTADELISVPAADLVNPRIDIIEVQVQRRLIDPTSRDVLDPGTGTFVPNTVNKTLTYNLNGTTTVNGAGPINYKTGTPAAVPVAPATDVGYLKIAEVDVGAAVASIAENKIRDLRFLLFPHGVGTVSGLLLIDAAAGTASAAEIIASPGMKVAAFYNNQGGAVPLGAELVIAAGGLSAAGSAALFVAHFDAMAILAGSKIALPNDSAAFGSDVIVTGPLQTALSTAGMEVALGQPVFDMLPAYSVQSGAAPSFANGAGANGNFPFTVSIYAR